MKRLTKILFLILLLSAIRYPLNASYASVPRLINYQGRLTDSNNVPLNGSYDLTFRIYDAQSAGNLLWEEAQSGVVIQKGIFSILLGSVTNLNLAFDKPYFLEIKVGNEVMSPRQQITSSGYAIRAEKAEDANTVANVGVSTTPSPNKILPLDSSGKFPTQVTGLKVYDSGWFAASINTLYTKNHNLGTTKCLINIYWSSDPNGAGAFMIPTNSYYYEPYQNEQVTYITGLTTTQIRVRSAPYSFGGYIDDSGARYPARTGYLRIIMLALE